MHSSNISISGCNPRSSTPYIPPKSNHCCVGPTGPTGPTGISSTLAVLYFNGGDSIIGVGLPHVRTLTYDHTGTTNYGRYGFMNGTGPTATLNFTGYTNSMVELHL